MNIYDVRSCVRCLLLAAGSAMMLASCAGYVPGKQAYWDAQVTEMCARDGGVRVFQKLHIKRSDLDYLGAVNGKIGIPIKELAHRNAPAYAEVRITYMRNANPQVSRNESTIVRRVDGAVLARWVVYARSGGDFPSPSQGTSYSCPDLRKITDDLQQLFYIEEI